MPAAIAIESALSYDATECATAFVQSPLDTVNIVIPILATIAGMVYTRVSPRAKWATLTTSAHQLVDQIYRYRLRVMEYDTKAARDQDGELVVEQHGEPLPQKVREARARWDFVSKCQEIYSFAISSEISKGGALKMSAHQRGDQQSKDARSEFDVRLRVHVVQKLHAAYKSSGADSSAGMKQMATQARQALNEVRGASRKKKSGASAPRSMWARLGLGKRKNKVDSSTGLPGAMGLDNDHEEYIQGAQRDLGPLGKLNNDLAGGDSSADKGTGAGASEVLYDASEVLYDDFTSAMRGDEYIACRARSITLHLRQRLHVLVRFDRVLKLLPYACAAVAALCALLGWYGCGIIVLITPAVTPICEYFEVEAQVLFVA